MASGQGVATRHPDLLAIEPQYTIIRDCLDGELAIKNKGEVYLPDPSIQTGGSRIGSTNAAYQAYLDGAQFVDYPKRTMDSLVGLAFKRKPTFNLPDELTDLRENANGSGLTLEQLAKELLYYVYSFGRAGLVVEFGVNESGESLTRQDLTGSMPRIRLIKPWDFVNWIGEPKVDKTVIRSYQLLVGDDGFSVTRVPQYEVYSIQTGRLTYELYRYTEGKQELEKVTENEVLITNATTQPLQTLTTLFVGSVDNDHTVDRPPSYGICSATLANYRSSAAFQRSLVLNGSPTFYFTGLTSAEIQKRFPDGIPIGGAKAINLPKDASAGILQSAPNVAAKEAMEVNRQQIVSMGASTIEQMNVAITATQSLLDFDSTNSPLISAAGNVAQALTDALKLCRQFVTTNEALDEEILAQLDVSSSFSSLPPGLSQELISLRQANYLSFGEMRNVLKRFGWANEEDDEELAELAEREQDFQAPPAFAPTPLEEEEGEDADSSADNQTA